MNKGKGLIRSMSRRGTRSDRKPVVTQHTAAIRESTVCERCGAVFSRRAWRRNQRVTLAFFDRAHWGVCPACEQVNQGEYFGRVLIRGTYAAANVAALRERIHNIDERARFTQPERRVLTVEPVGGAVLEVLTTSQKLAHRIVRELKKVFRGRASYHWSDRDGSLAATWERDDLPRAAAEARA